MPLVELGYMKRRVIVVDGPLSFRMRRLEAARACTVGLEILSLPLLAARLAGASVASRVPSKALNDAILDASIFHVVKNRSGVFASGMSILPRSSSCRQPLNECRQKLPLCILARSTGLCARMGCDASSP